MTNLYIVKLNGKTLEMTSNKAKAEKALAENPGAIMIEYDTCD